MARTPDSPSPGGIARRGQLRAVLSFPLLAAESTSLGRSRTDLRLAHIAVPTQVDSENCSTWNNRSIDLAFQIGA